LAKLETKNIVETFPDGVHKYHKLAQYGTDGRLLLTANFEVT